MNSLIALTSDALSLQQPIGDTGLVLGDTIESPLKDHETVMNDAEREQILVLMSKFSRRDQELFRMRFGVDDGTPRTHKELALEFDISEGRVRHIVSRMRSEISWRLGDWPSRKEGAYPWS